MYFYTVNLQHLCFKHVFSMRLEDCMEPDQMMKPADLDLQLLFFFKKKGINPGSA